MSSAFVQLFYGNCSAPTFSDAYLSEGKTKGELTRNQNSLLSPVDKVESTITTKIMSGQCNLQELKKLASTLALLPYVRFSQCSTSLMIQKLLVMVNNMLNDTFVGLEKEDTDYELMMLLAPPGSKLVPPLGGQTTCGDKHIHSTKKFHAYIVPTISALVHCCSMMLTSPYPAQVRWT